MRDIFHRINPASVDQAVVNSLDAVQAPCTKCLQPSATHINPYQVFIGYGLIQFSSPVQRSSNQNQTSKGLLQEIEASVITVATT